MAFDFPNPQMPQLAPLAGSFAENEVEAELKALFMALFDGLLASGMFDVNVLGAPHLGSFGLVRRAVNSDGLVLLQGDREEAATRYLYRAWKRGDGQGRGLHFLRTYLQMLFPNQCEVQQLWHEAGATYPEALHASRPDEYARYPKLDGQYDLDGTWQVGVPIIDDDADGEAIPFTDDEPDYWLTSRVMIAMSFESDTQSIAKLASVIGSVVPARLVPLFRFWLQNVIDLSPTLSSTGKLTKYVETQIGGQDQLYVTETPDLQFNLGFNETPGDAPKLEVPGISVDYSISYRRA